MVISFMVVMGGRGGSEATNSERGRDGVFVFTSPLTPFSLYRRKF
jgi:hypothetical protein